MKVITTIVITEKVSPGFEEQVKRNYEREFGGTDLGIKKHLQKLIPVLTDENIKVSFEIEEPNMIVHQVLGDNDEILGTYITEEAE